MSARKVVQGLSALYMTESYLIISTVEHLPGPPGVIFEHSWVWHLPEPKQT